MPNTIAQPNDSSIQYMMWDLTGATGAGLSSPGIVNGGRIGVDFDTSREEGLADQEDIRQGMNMYKANPRVRFTADSKPLLQNALRVSNVLPIIKFQGGTTAEGWAIGNGIVNSAELSFNDMHAPLEVNFELEGLSGVRTTSGATQAATASGVFTALMCILTVNGSDYMNVKATMSIKNNHKAGTHTGGGKATGYYRDPTHWETGREQHEIKITSRKPLGDSPIAVDVPSKSIGLIATWTLGANSFVMTYTGLAKAKGSWDEELKSSGPVEFQNTFWGAKGALTIT